MITTEPSLPLPHIRIPLSNNLITSNITKRFIFISTPDTFSWEMFYEETASSREHSDLEPGNRTRHLLLVRRRHQTLAFTVKYWCSVVINGLLPK